MKTVKATMFFEIEDDYLESMKNLEHHVEYLLDLEGTPEIKCVYGVKVEEETHG